VSGGAQRRSGRPPGLPRAAPVLVALLLALCLALQASWNARDHALVPAACGLPLCLVPEGTGHTCTHPTFALSGAGRAIPEPPRLTADAAVLVERATGAVIFDRDGSRHRAPASTTKILTALVALELGRPGDCVEVDRHAAYTPGSSMGLYPGDVFSLEDLLYGLMLASGNDAAVAVAEHIAGSTADFALLMNRRAWLAGADDARFANPHGLTSRGHYCSARDLALLTCNALNNRRFSAVCATREWVARERRSGREIHLRNINRLLHEDDAVTGVKTGTTFAAGRCLVASAKREGVELVAVVLHCDDRWGDARRLLDWGFREFSRRTLVGAGQRVARLPVAGADRAWTTLRAGSDLQYMLPRRPVPGHEPSLRLEVPVPLTAPFNRGAPVGRFLLCLGEEPVASIPLVAEDGAGPRTLGRLLRACLDALFTPAVG